MQERQSGVTLIELVIVVVIIGILAAVAVPSYRQYVIRSNRTEATSALLRLATAQEKFYLQNNRYAYPSEMPDEPPNGLGIGATTERGFYTLSVQSPAEGALAAAQQGFTVRAVPAAGSSQSTDTACALFEVTDRGVRSAQKSGGTSNTTECWK